MLIVPISAIPAQSFQCVLNNQNCTITIKKRGEYCYFSLICNGETVTENTVCLAGNNLVANGYYDIPKYELFNTRYKLCYVPFRFDGVNISSEE